ncbi:MAG: hypothetical protein ACFHHU_00730 [Porticoccaceae bacterium]
MAINIRAFLRPLHAAPGGDLCVPILGLERARLVLKDPHGNVLQVIPDNGQPWDYHRLVALEDQLNVSKHGSADLFLGEQMIGSTDMTPGKTSIVAD